MTTQIKSYEVAMPPNIEQNFEPFLIGDLLSSKPKQGLIFWLRMMNIFFTKAPLVMFETFEYACDYTHQTGHKINRNMLIIISLLSAFLVLLCVKRFCEYKKYQSLILGLLEKINTNSRILLENPLTNSNDGGNSIIENLRLDNTHKNILSHLQKSDFIAVSKKLKLPQPRNLKDKSRCPNSVICLEGVETVDLWLGIVWLGYCFIGKFHEQKLNTLELSVILLTAVAYMLLHFTLPHSDLGAKDSQLLSKLSTFFTVHSEYMLPQTRSFRGGSMPVEYKPANGADNRRSSF